MSTLAQDTKLILEAAAATCGRSMDAYWPARGNADLPEQCLVVHVAAAFINSGWMVYAETPFDDGLQATRLDLLAIDIQRRRFVALEAKRHFGHGLERSKDDAARLVNYWVRTRIDAEGATQQQRETAHAVTEGLGVVAGLTWVPSASRARDSVSPSTGSGGRLPADFTAGDDLLVPRDVPARNGRYSVGWGWVRLVKHGG